MALRRLRHTFPTARFHKTGDRLYRPIPKMIKKGQESQTLLKVRRPEERKTIMVYSETYGHISSSITMKGFLLHYSRRPEAFTVALAYSLTTPLT